MATPATGRCADRAPAQTASAPAEVAGTERCLVHLRCWLRRQEDRTMAKGTDKPAKNNKPKLTTKEKQEKKAEKKKKG